MINHRKPISLLLAVLMLCSLAASALAGSTIYEIFVENCPEELVGTDKQTGAADIAANTLTVYYSPEKARFVAAGTRADGTGEITVWNGVSMDQGMIYLYVLCQSWNDLTAVMPSGQYMILGLCYDDASKNVWVYDAAGAAAFAEAHKDLAE